MTRAALLLAVTLLSGIASASSAPSALPQEGAQVEWTRLNEDFERGKGLLIVAREAAQPAAKREGYHQAKAAFRSARVHLEICRKSWPEDERLDPIASQIAQFLYECRKCCPMEVKPG